MYGRTLLASVLCVTLLAAPLAAGPGQGQNGRNRLKDANLPGGYHILVFASGLNFPTGIAFGDNGEIYVSEAGGLAETEARILRVHPDGSWHEISDDFDAPITDLTFHDGWIYVSHLGKITRIRPDGSSRETIHSSLPSMGDHSNTEIVFGPDGRMYFGIGSATNSGVVGLDNLSWVERHPDFHDVPGDDIEVRAVNFETPNPLGGGTATTGAYQAFGDPAGDREPVDGNRKCTGSILVSEPNGDDLDVRSWGFRNPFGLGFDADGNLWTINNGMDARGSRPIANDPDAMFQVGHGEWYGWPDYSIGRPVNQPRFAVEGVIPELVLADHPELSQFAEGFAIFEDHVSANKFDFSSSGKFRFEGDAFVAETGSIPGGTGAEDLVGYRVTRVDMDNGDVSVFLANRSGQPAFITGEEGINKPIDVKFHPEHTNVMFVVDFGAFLPSPGSEEDFPTIIEPGSGAIYAIGRGNVNKALDAIFEDVEEDGGVEERVAQDPVASSSFNVSTSPGADASFSFQLDREAVVSIRVYDLAGRLVRTLADRTMTAGRHETAWDGLNDQGKKARSGVYLYRIESAGVQQSGKIVLMSR